jgi:hypothetical protein
MVKFGISVGEIRAEKVLALPYTLLVPSVLSWAGLLYPTT